MMRPPMQKTALHQNEANRLQHHQQQSQLQQPQSETVHLIPHKHLQHQQQQQQQLQTTTTALTPTIASNNIGDDGDTLITATTEAAHKSQKLEQHELLVENHLNNACFAQVQHSAATTLPPLAPQPHLQHKIKEINPAHSILQQHQQQQLASCLEPFAVQQPSAVFYNEFYQHQQHSLHQQQRPRLIHRGGNIDDNLSSVKLLDLSTSPPGREDSHTSVFRTPALECREVFHNHQTPSNNSVNSQRFSYTSQYSRSSSSDDSSSLSLSTACGNIGAGSVLAGGGFTNFASGSAREHHSNNSTVYNTDSTAYSSYSNTFDDAAENFIINFPADTTPTQPLPPHYAGRVGTSKTTSTNTNSPHPSDFPHQQQAHNYCLPLSETEPLLTNIEATVKDRQRAIYLNKNSASLIFTKKDLSQTAATYQQQQQQFRLQSKTNNNFNGGSVSTTSSSSNTLSSSSFTSSSSHSNTNASVRRSLPHSTTLRSFSEENYSTRRKPTKHLPATYHQQHRRSLQLNYNNNLVTTSTCGSIANNNHQHQHCCNIPSGCSNKGSNTNSAVLHKPHHNNHSYQQQQQQQTKLQQQQQQSSGYTTTSCTSNNTATATRKQYAYSWYAPVYSALEEELEHDSRDSSPIHNLATTKKSNIQQYHRHHDLNTSSLTAPAADTDNEREALLESRNNINIQTHLPSGNHKRGGVGGVGGGGGGGGDHLIKQLNPSKLALQHTRNSSVKGGLHTAKGISLNGGGAGGVSVGSGGDIAAVEGFPNYDLEGPHAGSLGLAGGPQPRRIRFGNFLKSLVGLRPSVVQRTNGTESGVAPPTAANAMGGETESVQIPSSPEITITRTPSEQNMVVLRDPSGRQDYNVVYSSREKLANFNGDRSLQTGSTSSLNVMQQKLWNIMRREGSAISLHQEKSQSIVHYTGLRKCETVIALTRQTTSPCSPTLSVGVAAGGSANKSQQRLSHTGSGIFSASGVEQIRPLNRLRNSVSSMNNTCSRCSSLLSLAASTSRFSLSNGALANQNPHHTHQHQHHSQQLQHQQQAPPYSQHQYQHHQHQRYPSNVSSSNISSIYSHSRDGSLEAGLHFAVKRNSRTSFSSAGIAAAVGGCQRNSNSTSASSRTPSLTSPTATNASTIKLTTPPIPPPPTENSSPPPAHPAVSTLTLALPVTAAAPYPVPTSSRVEDIRFLPGPIETTTLSTPLTLTSLMNMPTASASKAETLTKIEHPDKDENGDVIDGVSNNNSGSSSAKALSAPTYGTPSTSVNALVVTAATSATALAASSATASASASSPESIIASILHGSGATTNTNLATSAVPSRPFELFTCKLCLIDVEDASNSTVLHQCGCQFCTECMKAYVEFEISEGAYEISCPDAQCPEQGAMILPEIAILTTTNLMKKHHRYRLNREIELDKTRTWCPRAGCETVCLIGTTSIQSGDGNPSASTSAAAAATTTPTANVAATLSPSLVGVGVGIGTGTGIDGNIIPTPVQCAVQCPSCKDEFCSACKKTWHPNITCEEHSRRLAADGQDDIGIPFDNDLIKCCPMCAVPIEKDEGCAQMMCKRCKHVFCWYCLASLDDDFLLRHYDKGPCKNKLGHSRASVVWHRAQVIGIFAGFGILLLVASPLLLLAAPCIICCKCRSCSGSKIDEGDGDMDEATALQRQPNNHIAFKLRAAYVTAINYNEF